MDRPSSLFRTRPFRFLVLALVLAGFLTACGDDDDAGSDAPTDEQSGDEQSTEDAAGPAYDEALAVEVVANYSAGVEASYQAALTSSTAMDEAIDAFLADPSDATLQAAKDAWRAAREDYGLTEAFRFYGGPIDDEDGPEGLLNAWPMDEAYVDYVEGNPEAGIINNPDDYPTIDADLLVSLNEDGGEANISTGYHAIEFLLWGQDLDADGPGARPVADYVDAPNADRRSTYLATASDLVLEHLSTLVEEWAPDADNYRADFAEPLDDAVRNLLYSVGQLAGFEVAGERMTVALVAFSQEDEHSCFSDNTHRDIVANAQGIENVITGTYPGGVSGPGLADLVEAADADLGAQLRTAAADAVAAAEAIPAPFDSVLVPDTPDDAPARAAAFATVDALETEAETVAAAAAALGFPVEFGE